MPHTTLLSLMQLHTSLDDCDLPEDHSRILLLVTFFPALTETYLPHSSDGLSINGGKITGNLFQLPAKYYSNRMKEFIGLVNCSNERKIAVLCESIENLVLLAGCEFAKKKFTDLLSNLILPSEEYDVESFKHMQTVEKSFGSLITHVKTLMVNITGSLFMCDSLNSLSEEDVGIMSDLPLEKLSTELLTVADSLKGGIYKSDEVFHDHNNTGFSLQTTSSGGFTGSYLLPLAHIIDHFLCLESMLRDCNYARLQRARSHSNLHKKSALRRVSQLPDLLRTRQERSWINPVYIYGNWIWQEVMRDLGPIIAQKITNAFEECQEMGLNSPEDIHEKALNDHAIVCSVSSSIMSGKTIPQMTLHSFEGILNLMIKLLPYATLGSQYKPLSGLCSCYIDKCSQILRNMKEFLVIITNGFPNKTPVKSMYSALATCEDVCMVLAWCSLKMNNEVRMPFQGILQSYRDLEKWVKNALIQALTSGVIGCVLHDAEMDHWLDWKEFGQVGTPSRSVKNWQAYLYKAWSDLTSTASRARSEEIFILIYSVSLRMIRMRYSRCEPTYNRTKQIRIDLATAIAFCRSLQECLQAKGSFLRHLMQGAAVDHGILLSIMCLVTDPPDAIESRITPHGRFAQMNARSLSASMLRRNENLFETRGSSDRDLVPCLYALFSNNCSTLTTISSLDFTQKLQEVERCEFQNDLYQVLTSCSAIHADAFFLCAFTSLGKDANLLFKYLIGGEDDADENSFVWQNVFFTTLKAVIYRSLLRALRFLRNATWAGTIGRLVSSQPSDSRRPKSVEEDQGFLGFVLLVIQGLRRAVYLLPEWLLIFLSHVRSKISPSDDSRYAFGNIALHIIFHAACGILKTPKIWHQQPCIEVTEQLEKYMLNAAALLLNLSEGKFERPGGFQTTITTHLERFRQEFAYYFDFERPPTHQYADEQIHQICQRRVAQIRAERGITLASLDRVRKVLLAHGKLPLELATACMRNTWVSPDDVASCTAPKIYQRDGSPVENLNTNNTRTLLYRRWEMKDGASLSEEEYGIVKRVRLKVERAAVEKFPCAKSKNIPNV